MRAAYGVDVLDPAISCRRVALLLDRLPASARSLGEAWSAEAELLATLVDHVAYLAWVTIRANGGKPKKPKPYPRPEPPQRLVGTTPTRRGKTRAARRRSQDEPRKAAGWFDAANMLSGIRGAVVEDG